MENDYPVFSGMEPRPYQIEAYRKALSSNLLLVLPTGLGKTLVSAMLAYTYMKEKKKVIMLSPTRPLVMQHLETMQRLFEGSGFKITAITGQNPADERMSEWAISDMVISTPQTANNDIKNEIVFLGKFHLLIVDEAHRATGNYAYVSVADSMRELPSRRILAMTASPGSHKEKVEEIKKNLSIVEVIIKTDDDPDILPYVMGSSIKPIFIKPSYEQEKCIQLLQQCKDGMMANLQKRFEFVRFRPSRGELSKYIRELSSRAVAGEKSLFGVIPSFTAVIRLDVLMEYIETQGMEIGAQYLEELKGSQEKSMQRTYSILEGHQEFRNATLLLSGLAKYENPKFREVLNMSESLVKDHPESKCIVFTHYRKTSDLIYKYLKEKSTLLRPMRFVGQAAKENDPGMSQKEQKEKIEEFISGKYNVMLATSVAEEGLDIPSTDMVIFYEPVASEIRSIQRRGRTGRFREGIVFILIFSGTRDQAYYYASIRKEKTMVKRMKSDMGKKVKKPQNLDDF